VRLTCSGRTGMAADVLELPPNRVDLLALGDQLAAGDTPCNLWRSCRRAACTAAECSTRCSSSLDATFSFAWAPD
jgi:hypothetical protein